MTDSKFPAAGRSWAEIEQFMRQAREADMPWRGERLFKPAYFAGDDVLEVANTAYQMYITDNALYGRTAYPSLHRYEEDIIEMIGAMLNAPGGFGGNVTGGGTESNFMAVKTARDWARNHRPGARSPNMIVPRTAHPSFNKAAEMLGVDVIRMDRSPDFRADVASMAAAIDENTIMIVASAPPYPYGETDAVTDIAALAVQHDLWGHVDACLGGFVLPFAREFDNTIPDFDFSVQGVQSMSVDIHKYGYSAKSISALMLRDAELERYQRSTFDDWPSGLYSTANVMGSRSGGPLASAWAVMNYLGREGYRRTVGAHIAIRRRFVEGIEAIDGLEVLGTPHAYNFAFCAPTLDAFAIADGLADRDWLVGRGQEPSSVQLMINLSHTDIVPAFLTDLEAVVGGVRSGEITARPVDAVYAI